MPRLGPTFAFPPGGVVGFHVGPPTLGNLSLSPNFAGAGIAYSGTIVGKTGGSTVTATSSDGTILTVTGSTVTGTFAGAGTPTISFTETLAGATNSPHNSTDTTFVVEPVLLVLSLSPNTVVKNVAFSGTLSNTRTGSTVTATSSDGTVLTVTGSGTSRTVSGTFTTAGTPTLTFTETLAGYYNSPKVTSDPTFTVTTFALGTLTLTPNTASAGVAYSGTISGGASLGVSTFTATSSDGTILTVTGTTVTGTFASVGSPVITLTETNSSASNSPHVTTDNTFTVTAAYVGMLDTLSQPATGAYSVRLLTGSYSGPCMQVRRSSDNTTMNIGFVTSGSTKVLDTATLLTFCGAGNGFITIWYDQSASAINAIQATAAQQPQIVSAGAVVTAMPNARPALDNNINWVLGNTGTGPLPASYTDFAYTAATQWSGGNNQLYLFNGGNGGTDAYVPYTSGSIYFDSPGNDRIGPTASVFTSGVGASVILNSKSGAGACYYNGAVVGSGTGTTGTNTPAQFQLQMFIGGGYVSEEIFFSSGLDSTDISTIYASQSAYYGMPPSYTYVLDGLTGGGAGGAFSLRKLRSAYAGECINVRRDSDNATTDIGFVANVLDTASLLTFCGSANGFVTTWYDQSGNANNATQSTASQQPQIVASGVVITMPGSFPSMQFGGFNNMDLTFSYTSANPITLNTVPNWTGWSFNAIGGQPVPGGYGTSIGGAAAYLGWYVGAGYIAYPNTVDTPVGIPNPANNTPNVATMVCPSGSDWYMGLNGTNYTAPSASICSWATGTVAIMHDFNGNYFQGNTPEWITFGRQLSSGDQTYLESNQLTYYGI